MVHYRLSFPRPSNAQGLQAIYLQRVVMASRASLNGQVIGDSGFSEPEVGRYFQTPLFYTFPTALYAEGDNTLDIEVKAYANRFGTLDPVSVGNADELRPTYQNAYLQRYVMHMASVALAVIYVVLLTPVWWVRRDAMFGWFIAGSIFWGINGLNFVLHTAPIPTAYWEWVVHISVGLVPLCFSLFIFRLAGERRPHIERGAWILSGVTAIGTLSLAGDARFFTVVGMWQALMLVLGAYAMIRLFVFLHRNRDSSVFYIGTALLIVWVFALHDLLQQQLFDGQEGFWLNFASPLLLLAMGLLMVRRFLVAVSTAEELNVTLEKRVALAQESLATSYEELRILEMTRAVQEERERIYRNLHDDVGAKLLGLVISAQRSNQSREADLARSALQDLRDVVSRSAHPITPLRNLVADWHAETEQRCEPAQLKLHWEEDFPSFAEHTVSAEDALNLSRILREAVSNVLRHAQATKISVSVQVANGNLLLDIADDGVGISPDFKANRGISSMLARAETMQGSLTWETTNQGCTLHLRVPLHFLVVTEGLK